jgi:signal transduction histidine kinase
MIRRLKNGGKAAGGISRHSAFTREFVKATDIQVGIKVTHQPHVSNHLVAEVFHLLNERLSNLSRHMYARTAETRLTVENMKLVLRTANDNLKWRRSCILHCAQLRNAAQPLVM